MYFGVNGALTSAGGLDGAVLVGPMGSDRQTPAVPRRRCLDRLAEARVTRHCHRSASRAHRNRHRYRNRSRNPSGPLGLRQRSRSRSRFGGSILRRGRTLTHLQKISFLQGIRGPAAAHVAARCAALWAERTAAAGSLVGAIVDEVIDHRRIGQGRGVA